MIPKLLQNLGKLRPNIYSTLGRELGTTQSIIVTILIIPPSSRLLKYTYSLRSIKLSHKRLFPRNKFQPFSLIYLKKRLLSNRYRKRRVLFSQVTLLLLRQKASLSLFIRSSRNLIRRIRDASAIRKSSKPGLFKAILQYLRITLYILILDYLIIRSFTSSRKDLIIRLNSRYLLTT